MRIVKRYTTTHYTLYFPVDITIIHVNVLLLEALIFPVKKKIFKLFFWDIQIFEIQTRFDLRDYNK